MTNDKPWRVAALTFEPFGAGRERAMIGDVVIVRDGGRYWINSPKGVWANASEAEANNALNWLYGQEGR